MFEAYPSDCHRDWSAARWVEKWSACEALVYLSVRWLPLLFSSVYVVEGWVMRSAPAERHPNRTKAQRVGLHVGTILLRSATALCPPVVASHPMVGDSLIRPVDGGVVEVILPYLYRSHRWSPSLPETVSRALPLPPGICMGALHDHA